MIWNPQVWDLADSHIGSFSVCCKFKSLDDNFEWGQIGVNGPNDDYLRHALFEELSFLCLLGTFRGVWVGILMLLGFLQRDIPKRPFVLGDGRVLQFYY